MYKNIILKIRSGSSLYGTFIEGKSDLDYMGVYLSSPEELLGLNSSEIINDSIVSKREDSNKNDKDAVDCTYYELRKFSRLCLNANPTMLEVLFADEKNIVECNEYGRQLIENRHKFLSTKIKHSFCGYAFSQKKKSQVKTENLRYLYFARDLLSKFERSKWLYDYLDEMKKELGTKNWNYPDYIKLGDLRFNNQKVKNALTKINNRIDKGTHRADGMLEHGMDFKFMSHTLRLICEGEELLTTGDLKFPPKERDLIMKIKRGEINPSEVMEIIDEREANLEELHKEGNSVLPNNPNFNAVNDMVIGIYQDYLQVNWQRKLDNMSYRSTEKHGR